MDVFQLLGTIAINNTGAINSLREASQEGEKAESKLGNAFKKIGGAAVAVGKTVGAAMVAGGVAVTGLVTKSIQAYADYEQLVGGVQTLFNQTDMSLQDYAKSVGKSADEALDEWSKMTAGARIVQNNADKAFATAGMSANEYMETVTGFSASLISSLGGDTVEAAKLADIALIDMSDNANKMGSDMESIKNAYGGFAKQNYTMLDNLKLGYGGTQEEMKRLLKDAQAISGVEYDISSYADVVSAIHVIQEEMGIAGATANEAATTISGSLGMMKAAWQNVVTSIAMDDEGMFEEYLDNLIDSVATFGENIIPRIETALQGVVKLIDRLAPLIIQKIPEIFSQLLPAVVDAITGLITSIVNIIPGLIDTVMDVLPSLIEGLQKIINALISALPGVMQALVNALPTVIPMLIDALISMIVTLMTTLPQIIQPIIDKLPEIVLSIVTALLDNLPILIDGTVTLIIALVNAIPQIIVPLIEMMPQIITMLVMAIVDSSPALIDGFKSIWEAVKAAISAVVDSIIQLVGKLWDWCVEYVGPVLENYKQIIQNAWNSIKTKTANIWNGIKSSISSVWEGIKSGVSNAINSVQTTVSNIWNGIKSTTSRVWNGIKTAIETPINKARDLVKSAIDKIKGFFDFEFKWPKMSMPHFGISPSGWKISDLLEGSIPKLSIDWYAKAMENPMVMNGPTVFGFNPMTNSFLAGGEAGSEVVSGTNTLMTMISQAVASQNGGIIGYLQQLISMLADYLPQIINNIGQDIVADDGTIIAHYAPLFDTEFGRMKAQKGRGR